MAPAPQHTVTASGDIVAAAILLPPITQSIGKLPESAEPSSNQVVIGRNSTHPTTSVVYKVALAASGGMKFPEQGAEPQTPPTGIASLREEKAINVFGMFWFVKQSDNAKE